MKVVFPALVIYVDLQSRSSGTHLLCNHNQSLLLVMLKAPLGQRWWSVVPWLLHKWIGNYQLFIMVGLQLNGWLIARFTLLGRIPSLKSLSIMYMDRMRKSSLEFLGETEINQVLIWPQNHQLFHFWECKEWVGYCAAATTNPDLTIMPCDDFMEGLFISMSICKIEVTPVFMIVLFFDSINTPKRILFISYDWSSMLCSRSLCYPNFPYPWALPWFELFTIDQLR